MKNCRQTGYGYQLYTRIRGQFVSEHRPKQPTPSEVRNWVEEQRVRARLGAELPAHSPSLEADVRRYLTQVQTMPTYRHRKDDLQLWLKALGSRPRASITPSLIRAQLERWRADGYAASTCNHRRTALMHLWTVLDGRSATNPARDVPRYREEPGPPRALSLAAIVALMRHLPTSQTKARLRLMATTGWPPAQIAKLTPQDIRWGEAVFVRARRKGHGVAGVWLPLLPQAWRALRSFKRQGCWGAYSTSAARKSLRLAAKKAIGSDRIPNSVKLELVDVTPYQFRHSFLTWVAAITRDDRAVKVLAQHADIRTTHRYTEATADPRALAALGLVAEKLQELKGARKHA
jgi:integrase